MRFEANLFERHPRPWRVTDAYRKWWANSAYAANPPAIVDAGFDEDADNPGNDSGIVVSSSEWLQLDIADADAIVEIINRAEVEP